MAGYIGSKAVITSGVSASIDELNIIDGVTATTAELNKIDGVTATTAELNFIDGVTSLIQTQLNTKSTIASPTFTGTAAAPTASSGTNTTQLATTAFVQTATPFASQNVKGMIKAYVANGNLYITTS